MLVERLLRLKDLYLELGMARSTVANWIANYAEYIPTVKEGNVTYYKPEALDVLQFIKECREENYIRQEIIELLDEKGFTKIEETVREVELEKLAAETEERLNTQTAEVKVKDKLEQKKQEEAKKSGGLSDEDIERMNALKHQLEMLKEEVAATAERKKQQKKGLLARLFNR